ncbi:MAG: secretion activating protein [Novosphingobium sp. 28-62-57]|uniref:glycoside hydrolase family 108 protein n=2 Tax=unclassified Novosphingobium TaxID=2644732 RepID=UPI000BD76AA7|nr:N-acetylmuramidase [Novosphingobium sp.]OYW51199.1 MAG: secretion activating protein [Novosphingobium sp. 12-62-10]OYZ07728.1 MAG: secretion activating protein [Novosphingobium sp. 28-62-57]
MQNEYTDNAASRKSATAKKTGIAASIAVILAAVFAAEGGYVNDPIDPGGETNFGITKRVAVAHGYTGPMRDLPKDKAGRIYVSTYIEKPGFMPMVEIEPAVAEELVDTGVNMGPARPSRWFQQSLNEICGSGIGVDGKVGRATIGAYRSCQLRMGSKGLCIRILDRLDAKQSAEYDRLVRVNPALIRFRRGWQNHRVGNVSRSKCGSQI